MTFTVDCGVKETLSPQSRKQTATERAFGNLSYHTRTHKNNDEPHGMKELNQESNALHQTPEYISAYWEKQRPPQSSPLKQQAASFSYRALRRLSWGGNRLGRSAWAPHLHLLPRAARALLCGRGIILVTPLAGLRARPFRKASRDPLSSRRAATGSFQSRNDRPQLSRAAARSGSGAARPALPPPPALSWPLAAAGGSRRLPALGGLPAPKSRPQAAGRRDPAAPERSGAFPPSGGRRRPGPRAGGPEGPPRFWGRLRQCPNTARAAAGGPSTTRLPLHT